MIMNQISNDMLELLLEGDMHKIAEALTCTKITDDEFIMDRTSKEDIKKGWTTIYINIANFIQAHCTTSEVTDIMNRFLAKNKREVGIFSGTDDVEYWNKFDKVCKILGLSPSTYVGRHTTYTYNYDNDLSQDIEFRILEDEYSTYYVLIEVHLGGDARGNFSDTVLLELNDIDHFYHHNIDGWVEETQTDYDNIYAIFEDVDRIENNCLYNKEGYEIRLNSGLYY